MLSRMSDLIGDHHGLDQVTAAAFRLLTAGQGHRNDLAGVGGVVAVIGVVEIEIADQDAVDQSGPLGGDLPLAADDACLAGRAERLAEGLLGDRCRLRADGAESAGQRVEKQALARRDDVGGQIAVAHVGGVLGHELLEIDLRFFRRLDRRFPGRRQGDPAALAQIDKEGRCRRGGTGGKQELAAIHEDPFLFRKVSGGLLGGLLHLSFSFRLWSIRMGYWD